MQKVMPFHKHGDRQVTASLVPTCLVLDALGSVTDAVCGIARLVNDDILCLAGLVCYNVLRKRAGTCQHMHLTIMTRTISLRLAQHHSESDQKQSKLGVSNTQLKSDPQGFKKCRVGRRASVAGSN